MEQWIELKEPPERLHWKVRRLARRWVYRIKHALLLLGI